MSGELAHEPDSPAAGPAAAILIVDDSETARAVLRAVVAEVAPGANVAEADSGESALRIAAELCPDVVLMDIGMPGIGGIAATAELARTVPSVRTIVYSGSLDAVDVRRALEAGAAGYTVKSGDPAELRQAVVSALAGRAVLASDVVRPVIAHYVELLELSRRQLGAAIESLAAAVEAKDWVTATHLERVTTMAQELAGQIAPALATDEDFRYGCLLHDVGKIGIPEAVLCKPGPLDEAEWTLMRTHPTIGIRVIEPLRLGEMARAVVRSHHENWDGKGYPDGLAGDAIPLAARIFAVCDALDALTSDRPYRKAVSMSEALGQISSEAGSRFDPDVVRALEAAVADGSVHLPDR